MKPLCEAYDGSLGTSSHRHSGGHRKDPVDIFTFIAILVVGGPIAQAIARRISRPRDRGGTELVQALEQTEQRLDDTERHLADTQERLAEVEERLDFAERLLARQNARDQLGP